MKKFLRYLIIVLVVFLALIIAFMAFSPKNMNFRVTETVKAPPYMVFNLVNDLSNWPGWSTVKDLDEDVTFDFTRNTTGEGARITWKGNEDVGEVSRKIVQSVKGESIRTEIEIEGWDNYSYGQWTFEPDGKHTKVIWEFQGGDTPFFFRPFNVLMKGGLKKAYRKSLENLADLAEERAEKRIYNGYEILDGTSEAKHFLMNRQEVSMENIQQFYAQNLGALFMKAQKANLTMDGMPSGLFFSEDIHSDKLDMAAAIPIQEEKDVVGAQTLTLPESRVVQVNFYGDYSGTHHAHAAIEEYLRDYNLFHSYPVIEEYVTDPGEEEDPSKWLTRITYYIVEN